MTLKWYPRRPKELEEIAEECPVCEREMRAYPCEYGGTTITFYCFCGEELEIE